MRIQVVNDLHMEFGHWPQIELAGDVLCVAGDLCAWKNRNEGLAWLIEQTYRFEKVFYILGNHEHYGMPYYTQVRDYWLDAVNNRDNLHMPVEGVEYNGFVFLGDTLWTDLNRGDAIAIMDYQFSMNDAKWVKHTKYLDENALQKERLETRVLANIDKPIIMMTHHLPCIEMITPRWRGDRLNPAFANMDTWATDLLTKYGNIKLWHFGHTHDTVDMELGGCRFICNPYGYYNYGTNREYKNNMVVEV